MALLFASRQHCNFLYRASVRQLTRRPFCFNSARAKSFQSQRQRKITVVASQPETEEARSPLEAPQEWEAPMPSKRPDIFPEFEKLDRTILPKPLPGDPEMPDEEEEEAKKRTEPGDPDPESKPGEPDDPEPGDPGQDPEKSEPNIPTVPE